MGIYFILKVAAIQAGGISTFHFLYAPEFHRDIILFFFQFYVWASNKQTCNGESNMETRSYN